jgi:MFS superfamily sulfate permease-like transporter
MGNVAAILGVVLLLAGVVFVALFGNSRNASWGPVVGIALVVLGLSVELVGAVAVAA